LVDLPFRFVVHLTISPKFIIPLFEKMPKKFAGENSKAAAARERKNAAKAEKANAAAREKYECAIVHLWFFKIY